MKGVVRIRLMSEGQIVNMMYAAAESGFTEYAPGGVRTLGEEQGAEDGWMIHIPNPITIDEVLVDWSDVEPS
jgi:hypothetical protein